MAARYHTYLPSSSVLSSTFTTTTNSEAFETLNYRGYAYYVNWTNIAPSATSFVDGDVSVANNTITETSHGYLTGLKGQLTTTGTLPTGLSTLTNYWIIKVDNDTYKLASSLANAQAGTAIDITAAAGGGTHTFTPTTVSGIVRLQASNSKNSNYVNISGTDVNITGSSDNLYNVEGVYYRYARIQIEMSAGQITAFADLSAKGH